MRDSSDAGSFSLLSFPAEKSVALDAPTAGVTVHRQAVTEASGHGRFVIGDDGLLMAGHYEKQGGDLVISLEGRKAFVPGYFRGEDRPAVFSDSGLMLTGGVVERLAGATTFAQAASTDAASPAIGRIAKITGTAVVIRNGVTVELAQDDSVYKNDVVQCGSGTLVGISFIDGTALSLGAGARIVLNEMVYEPGGTANSALLSVVQGTISFVAGQSAKSGSMKVDTPVATLGIRGTAGVIKGAFVPGQDFSAMLVPPPADDKPVEFSLLEEPDGSIGAFVIIDKTTGDIIADVSRVGEKFIIRPVGSGQLVVSRQLKQTADLAEERDLVNQVFAIAFQKVNESEDKKFVFGAIGSPAVLFGNQTLYEITDLAAFIQLASNQLGPIPGRPHNPATTTDVDPLPTASVANIVTWQKGGIGNVDEAQGPLPELLAFSIGGRVTIHQILHVAPYFNVAYDYLPGSGKVSAVDIAGFGQFGADTPFVDHGQATTIRSLLGTNFSNGSISLDRSAFEFLGKGESVTYTISFDVYGGPPVAINATWLNPDYVLHLTLTITVNGLNDAPQFPATGQYRYVDDYAVAVGDANAHAVVASPGGTPPVATLGLAERTDTTGLATDDSVSITLDFIDEDFSDTGPTYAKGIAVASVAASGVTTGLPSDPAALKALTGSFLTLLALDKQERTNAGTVSLVFRAPDATFDYLAAGQRVTLSYLLTITDQNGAGASEQIDIVITGTNDRPVIAADLSASHALAERSSPTGSPLADAVSGSLDFRDVDLADSHATPLATLQDGTITWTNAQSQSVDLSLLPAASLLALQSAMSGVIGLESTNTSHGRIDWQFSVADHFLDFLASGETLTLVYDITVADLSGAANATSAARTVTIIVTGTNDVPVIAADTGGTAGTNVHDLTETNAALSVSGALAVSDADVTNTVAAAVHDVTIGGTGASHLPAGLDHATLLAMMSVDPGDVIDASHTGGTIHWSFDSAPEAFDFLATGETLVLTYTVRATDSDPSHATADQTVVVQITGTNDAPVLAADSGGTGGTNIHDLTETNSPLAVSGSLAVSDADVSNTLAASVNNLVVGGAGAAHLPSGLTAAALKAMMSVDSGDVIDASHTTGTVHWTFGSAPQAFDFLAAGEQLTLDYTIRVTDSDVAHATADQHVVVTITGSNDAPVMSTSAFTLTPGIGGAFSISGITVADPDSTDTLTAAATASSGLASPSPASGTAANSYGFSYTPGAATAMVTFSVTDSAMASDTVTFVFANSPAAAVTLAGTAGKDVIFGSTYGDDLTGGSGADQFVLSPGAATPVTHTIEDFQSGIDKIDLRAFTSLASVTLTQQGTDTAVQLDANDVLLLKHVLPTGINVATDFLLYA